MTLSTPTPVTLGKPGVKPVTFCNSEPFSIIAGTCALETRDITLRTASHLVAICAELGIGLVYKGSFDKANRTSLTGTRGMGLEEGLKLLQEIRTEFGVPVLTDVHEITQVEAVASAVDVIQIPAFLSRQTDLLVACGKAAAAHPGLAVNIKKGQFMAPADMHKAVAKVSAQGTENVMQTERGVTFGYNNLVVDMRGLEIMAENGYPVIFDATHSVMQPSARGDASGGERKYVGTLARAAVAVGVAGLFLEVHPNPAEAWSDKETQVPLAEVASMLGHLKALDSTVKTWQKAA